MLIMRLNPIVPRPPIPLAGDALGEPTSAPAASRGSQTPVGSAVARRRWRTCLISLLITAGLGLLPGALCHAGDVQPIIGPSLPLTTTIVNNGPGDQSDPHVSDALVSYTDMTNTVTIHVHDLVTGEDTTIPNDGAVDFLAKISGTTVVYVHFTAAGSVIRAYDVATDGPPVELAPQAGINRRLPAIGGPTVAWSDFGFHTDPSAAELVLYDLPTGTTTRLTNDLLFDTAPAVSPSGDVVVWMRCQGVGGAVTSGRLPGRAAAGPRPR